MMRHLLTDIDMPPTMYSEQEVARGVLVGFAGLDGPIEQVYKVAKAKTDQKFNGGKTWDAERVAAAALVLGIEA